MLNNLLTATCNLSDGVLDLYDVVIKSLAAHKDEDGEDLVVAMTVDFAHALDDRPALRRTVAMMGASLIAADRFMNGEDYATAINESRDLCLKALSEPRWFMLDAYRLYTRKKDVIVALVKDLQENLDEDGSPLEQVPVVLDGLRKILNVLRPALPAAKAA